MIFWSFLVLIIKQPAPSIKCIIYPFPFVDHCSIWIFQNPEVHTQVILPGTFIYETIIVSHCSAAISFIVDEFSFILVVVLVVDDYLVVLVWILELIVGAVGTVGAVEVVGTVVLGIFNHY